jgi:NitT/TauT family transport system permease protein
MGRLRKIAAEGFNKLFAISLFLLLWELCGRYGWLNVNPLFLPPFSKVAKALFGALVKGELWKHISISLRRSLTGFSLGMGLAIPLGLSIGWFKRFGVLISPLLQVFRNMPTLALLPVFVMFFGIGEFSKTMLIFWGVLWATLLNTISGVRNVDPQLIKASRSMGTSPLRLFATVILPASLPYIFAGMRISATTSILILIAAEMMGASRGLGFALFFYQANYKVAEMYAYLVVMAALGTSLNFTLEAVEKRSFRWRDGAGSN